MKKHEFSRWGAAAIAGLIMAPVASAHLTSEVEARSEQQAPGSAPTAPDNASRPTVNSGYTDHPAVSFTGAPKPLSLTARQRYYRTRLAEAYQAPVDFGGSLVVAQIGCGIGCSIVYALDKSSGKVFEFPLGREQNPELEVNYRPDSALIWALWKDRYSSECKAQPWKLGARGFARLSPALTIPCEVEAAQD